MNIKQQAKSLILLAIDENQCTEIGVKCISDSCRGIMDNAIRFLDFHEPDMKIEAPYVRSQIIKEIEHYLNNAKMIRIYESNR